MSRRNRVTYTSQAIRHRMLRLFDDAETVRVHKYHKDIIMVLIVSESWEGMGVSKRISHAIDRIEDVLPDISRRFTTIVETVTPQEYATRSVPWPR